MILIGIGFFEKELNISSADQTTVLLFHRFRYAAGWWIFLPFSISKVPFYSIPLIFCRLIMANGVGFDQKLIWNRAILTFQEQCWSKLALFYYPINFECPTSNGNPSTAVSKELEVVTKRDLLRTYPNHSIKSGLLFCFQQWQSSWLEMFWKLPIWGLPKGESWEEGSKCVTYISTSKESTNHYL